MPSRPFRFRSVLRVAQRSIRLLLLLEILVSPFCSAIGAQAVQGKRLANFVDEAVKAGLTAKNTFGGVDTKKFIIETTGTGVAIFDYDNDGWPDIFVVNGTTLDPMPGASKPTNHLPQQPRRHIHRRYREGWPRAHRLGTRRLRRRLRQRRQRRSVCHLLRQKCSLPQQWKRNLYGC